MQRLQGLDGLRGLAAVGVAVLHAHGGLPGTFWFWSFVDLFFVLSGFLITGILLREGPLNARALRAFWIRRILRIWPVYYVTLCGCLLAFVGLPLLLGKPARSSEYLVESFFFLQFWRDWWPPSAPAADWWHDYVPWFAHAWSLAVEEQFYLVWPLALALCMRQRRLLLIVLLCLLAGTVTWRAADLSLRILPGRADGLILGSILALLHHSGWLAKAAHEGRLRRLGIAVLVPALLQVGAYFGTVIGMPWGVDESSPGVVLALSCCYACLVAWVVVHPQSSLVRALEWRPLVHLGSLSYALYMFHLPIIGLFVVLTPHFGTTVHNPLVTLLLWLTIIGVPELSRRTLERWALHCKSRLPRVERASNVSAKSAAGRVWDSVARV